MDSANPRPSPTPVHDWLLPRLEALVAEAEGAGFSLEAVAASIVDLVTAPPFVDETGLQASASRSPLPESSAAPDAAGLEFATEVARGIKYKVEHEALPPRMRQSFRFGR